MPFLHRGMRIFKGAINTKKILNDLRKFFSFEKIWFLLKEFQFVMTENLVEPGMHYLPQSYTNDVINI